MAFTGQLRGNEIFASLYNMIISQQVFADNIKGTNSKLVDHFKVDGTLYGDTKLYYATDVLKSAEWGVDAEAGNLLALYRPEAPEQQAVTISNFRQICLTVDNYLSKRAWSTEGAFASFNSVILGMIRDTKRVYDSTLFNSYLGTEKAIGGKQNLEFDLTTTATGEEKARYEGMKTAEEMANLFVELQDVNRDYNDYGNLRSYDMGDLMVVWNSKFVNKIKKIDLPTIFHNNALIDKFEENVLPSRYFGNVNNTAGTAPSSNTTVRSLIEADYDNVHVFPGDLLPAGAEYSAKTTYTEDASVICKIMHKTSIPFMSAFEVGTSFFNPKSLTETHYLTWGYSDLCYLKNYPFITITAKTA